MESLRNAHAFRYILMIDKYILINNTYGVAIKVHLDRVMVERGIGLTELAARVDLTLANLSILKNNKARAMRFSTLEALCRELQCQPGDLLECLPEKPVFKESLMTLL